MTTIKHKQCPQCGNRLKHYYYYCGKCGNRDITNWSKTIKFLLIFLCIIALIVMFTFNQANKMCGDKALINQVVANAILGTVNKKCE